jgi:predicted nucleic acid-binding Zn ribbon protein
MYGVDQCRVCGTAIRPHGRRVREFQEKANRKPPIPEEEWRRRGYLCPPTPQQLNQYPAGGCCTECGRKEMRKFFMVRTRLVLTLITLVVVIAFALFVGSYMHH